MKTWLLIALLSALILGFSWWLAPAPLLESGAVEGGGVSNSSKVDVAAIDVPRPLTRSPAILEERSERPATRSPELSVQVVDSLGTPLHGVPVGLRAVETIESETDRLTETTDGDLGVALFEELPFTLNQPIFVHIDALGFESLGVVIQRDELDGKPVRITLPAYGSIAVRVQDPEGNPIRSSWVELADPFAPASSDGSQRIKHKIATTSGEFGNAVFDFVALGRQVIVSATSRFQSTQHLGGGPTRAGERVAFDLVLTCPEVQFVGRFVNESAQPIAKCRFTRSYLVEPVPDGGGGGGGGGMDWTDHDGRFNLTIPRFKGSMLLHLSGEEPSDCPSVRVNLDGECSSGTKDLGDIVMPARRELVSGRVVDDIGNPIGLAMIFGERRVEDSPRAAWNYEERLLGHSGTDGTFVLAGSNATDRIHLRATKSTHMDGAIENVVPGATNVWITLTRSGRIEGKLVLDRAGESARLWALVFRRGAELQSPESTLVRDRALVDHDGAFELPNVWPGECGLAICIEGDPIPVTTIDGLLVKSGETASSPRLESIDLRGKIAENVGAKREQ